MWSLTVEVFGILGYSEMPEKLAFSLKMSMIPMFFKTSSREYDVDIENFGRKTSHSLER